MLKQPTLGMYWTLAQFPFAAQKAWWTVAEAVYTSQLPKQLELAVFDSIPESFAAESVNKPTAASVKEFA